MAKVVYLTKGQKSKKKSRIHKTRLWKRVSCVLLFIILVQLGYYVYLTTNL